MKRRIVEPRRMVYCPLHSPSMMNKDWDAEKCSRCDFFVNETESGVDCEYDEAISDFHFHVTEIETSEGKYHIENVKSLSKAQQELYEKNDYDACKFCAFCVPLKNDDEYCKLRVSLSANNEEVNPFLCYEDEFWVKEE